MIEKQMTEKESLEIITKMIERTKARYMGSGNILLMWGYLGAIVSALVWILLVITRQNIWNWLWFAIPLIGMPTTLIMARREHREHGAVTYSDKITSQLWTIFSLSEVVLTIICLGFAALGGIQCWAAMLVYSLLLAPGAEIAQGLIVREKSLVAGGIIGLAIGLVTVCCTVGGIPLEANWFMPLFIFAFVAMMIIPGYIINRKASKNA